MARKVGTIVCFVSSILKLKWNFPPFTLVLLEYGIIVLGKSFVKLKWGILLCTIVAKVVGDKDADGLKSASLSIS